VDLKRLLKSPVPSNAGPEPQLIRHREQTIPFFSLNSLLKKTVKTGVSAKALVVQQSDGTIAFGVDRILGQQEVVVKPLDDQLFRLPGMAGATDLGDGLPTLVLDLATLGAALCKTPKRMNEHTARDL
jgi:two-component system, chemotaxis family, sensor kinase CheA